jgi:hypothetical protein
MHPALKMPSPDEFWKRVKEIAQRAKRWEVPHNKEASNAE